MASRRMFAKEITGAARFLRMPASARLLYYDLGMHADDDGFVEAFAVMRMTGAAEDDLRVLDGRGFVRVLNDDLVTWITDWRRNNLIKKDRYRPSIYANLLPELPQFGSEPGTNPEPNWNQNGTILEPKRNPNGTKLEPQVRIGKDRLDKGINTLVQKQENFDSFWAAYPRKSGKKKALESFKKIKNVPIEKMLAALEEQKRSEQWNRENGRFIPLPATWLNQGRWDDELAAGYDAFTDAEEGIIFG